MQPSFTPLGTPVARRSVPLTRIRTALICSGQLTLHTRNLFERYRDLLDPRLRDEILSAVPGGWSSVEVGIGHTAACEGLGMSPDDAFACGAAVGEHLNGFVLDTLARAATGLGATPWTVFGVYGRLLRRLFDGGDFAIDRLGAKEARVELRDVPLCGFSYFRDTYRGANHAALGRFTKRVEVVEVPGSASATGVAVRISWV